MLKTLNQVYKDRIAKGGEGSGCQGENCGRPAGSAAQGGIPEFKNTNEAMTYGLTIKNKPEKINELKVKREELLQQTKKIREMGDSATMEQLQEGMNIAVKAQFLREAVESAEGIGRSLEDLRRKVGIEPTKEK